MKHAPHRAVLAALALVWSGAADAQRSDMDVVSFDAPVTAVRQAGNEVFVRAGGWVRLSLCDAGPVCMSPGSPPSRATAADGIPFGYVATASGGGATRAWYTTPTSRYDHGVLGDAIEGGGLAVEAGGHRFDLVLDARFVFEDIAPRLADLDGDGANEIVTIRTDVNAGAAIAVYGLVEGVLVELAAIRPIGRRHRWLNVAGIADYSGDGRPDIAIVKTPHIGGELEVLTLRGHRLVQIASANGFSNHPIGSTELGMSATALIDGDSTFDLVLPDSSRLSLRYVSLRGGSARILDATPLPGRIATALGVLSGPDGPVVVAGLDRGRLAVVRP